MSTASSRSESVFVLSVSALGLPENVDVQVTTEGQSWGRDFAPRLIRQGDRYLGDVSLAPGEMFLVLVRGIQGGQINQLFELRRSAGLTVPEEHSPTGPDLFMVITDDPRFPVTTEGMPYPYNSVPKHLF